MGATALRLRCPRCKKYREWDSRRDGYDKRSDKSLVPTGRSKVISRTAAGVLSVYSVEVKHDGEARTGGYCGHVFWTTHPDAVLKVHPGAESRRNATVKNYGHKKENRR
jgi:hypothetical protein